MPSAFSHKNLLLLSLLTLLPGCSSTSSFAPSAFDPNTAILNADDARRLDPETLSAKSRIRRNNFTSKTFLETPAFSFDASVPDNTSYFRLEADITAPGISTFRLVLVSQHSPANGSINWKALTGNSSSVLPLTLEKSLNFMDESLREIFSAPLSRDFLENIPDAGITLVVTGNSTPAQIYLPKLLASTILQLASIHDSGEPLLLPRYYE